MSEVKDPVVVSFLSQTLQNFPSQTPTFFFSQMHPPHTQDWHLDEAPQ